MCKDTVSILHNKCLEVRKKIEAKKIWSVLNENSCRISLPDLFQSLQKNNIFELDLIVRKGRKKMEEKGGAFLHHVCFLQHRSLRN